MENELDWRDLPAFLAVGRVGSMTGAAELLGVTQPTLSRRIANLEESLGVVLLHRGRHGAQPTAEGAALLGKAEGVETAVQALVSSATGLKADVQGRVRVATTEEFSTYLLAPAAAALRRQWPQISLDLVASTAIANLSRREADIALRLGHSRQPDLFVKRVATLPCRLFASADYLARIDDPSDLSRLDWVELDDEVLYPEHGWLNQHVPKRRTVFRSSNTMAGAAAAAGGAGVILLPDAHASVHPTLRALSPSAPPIFERPVWMLVHRDLRSVPRVRAVIDWISEVLAQLSAAAPG